MTFLLNQHNSSSNIKKLNIIKRDIFNIPSSFSFIDSKKIIYYSENEYYIGQINDDYIPEGEGTYYYSNKEIYYGDFLKGKKNGIGVYNYLDGCFYIGNWENNLKEGEGVYYNHLQKWYFHGTFKKDFPFLGTFYNINHDFNEKIQKNDFNEKWEKLFQTLQKTDKKEFNDNIFNNITIQNNSFELSPIKKNLFGNFGKDNN
jgi:hypothetical protein